MCRKQEEGTFTIDFVESKSNSLKCMGVAKGAKLKKDKNAERNIARGIEKLFKKINN